MEKIVHGFLSSCLDYCNALFTRINKSSPSHLQAIQNDDARLLRHSAKQAEISHTYIKSTKWTSSKLFVSASSHRCSQSLFTSSKSQNLLVIPRTRLKTEGTELPLCGTETLGQFTTPPQLLITFCLIRLQATNVL